MRRSATNGSWAPSSSLSINSSRVDVADYAPLHQVTGLTNRWRVDELGVVNSAQQPPAADLLADLADRLQAGQFRVPRPLAESPPKQNQDDGPTAT